MAVRRKWYHYVFFLFGIAALSRLLTTKGSPAFVDNAFRTLGNLFNATFRG